MNKTSKESFLNNILASHKNVITYAIILILQRKSSLTGSLQTTIWLKRSRDLTILVGSMDPSGMLQSFASLGVSRQPHDGTSWASDTLQIPSETGRAHTIQGNVFLMKTSILLSQVGLTCTCCLCVFSIFGSIDKGPRTLTISSFSASHCFNWASTVWNWVRLFEDSSSFCRLSTVNWLSSCHLESRRKKDRGWNRCLFFIHLIQLYLWRL